jgi:CBS domain-containing protein
MTRVSDIIAGKGDTVFDITPDATVYDAIAAMEQYGVGALLVRDAEIHGIVTERDYLRKVALKGRSSRDTPVREIMSSSLVFATPEQDVEDVLATMSEARIRHLPVMDEGKLAGLVSIGDCVKQISRDRKAQVRLLSEYIGMEYPR